MNIFRRDNRDRIRTDRKVGAVTFRKKILRHFDLPDSPADLQKIGLGTTSEIRIFADFPIDIQLGDSGKVVTYRTELSLQGNISDIKIRNSEQGHSGRVVIFVGDPILDDSFTREDPNLRASKVTEDIATALAGASVTSINLGSFSFGNKTGVECMYVKNISFVRTLGYVDRITYEENESGLNRIIMDEYLENPSSKGNLKFATPFRISSNGVFRYHGSVEVGGTGVTAQITKVSI